MNHVILLHYMCVAVFFSCPLHCYNRQVSLGLDYFTSFLSHYIGVQVWFREGISHHNPEGSCWEEVQLPGEVVQISCGPGDLVWAVLWEGQFIVREGIGRDCPKGTRVLCGRGI